MSSSHTTDFIWFRSPPGTVDLPEAPLPLLSVPHVTDRFARLHLNFGNIYKDPQVSLVIYNKLICQLLYISTDTIEFAGLQFITHNASSTSLRCLCSSGKSDGINVPLPCLHAHIMFTCLCQITQEPLREFPSLSFVHLNFIPSNNLINYYRNAMAFETAQQQFRNVIIRRSTS